ncbi:MAG: DUF4190 domain-containing protein [Anaerolineae bacterium]|nr:DUF4190 domain-containing protein [Anaerolineae bacterium]
MAEEPRGSAIREREAVDEVRYEQPAPAAPQTSALAVVSLVSGIVAWFLLPVLGAIAAVITGHLAKREIRESQGALTGDGLATAGLVLGYIQLGLIALGIIVLIVLLLVGFGIAGIGLVPWGSPGL